MEDSNSHHNKANGSIDDGDHHYRNHVVDSEQGNCTVHKDIGEQYERALKREELASFEDVVGVFVLKDENAVDRVGIKVGNKGCEVGADQIVEPC